MKVPSGMTRTTFLSVVIFLLTLALHHHTMAEGENLETVCSGEIADYHLLCRRVEGVYDRAKAALRELVGPLLRRMRRSEAMQRLQDWDPEMSRSSVELNCLGKIGNKHYQWMALAESGLHMEDGLQQTQE